MNDFFHATVRMAQNFFFCIFSQIGKPMPPSPTRDRKNSMGSPLRVQNSPKRRSSRIEKRYDSSAVNLYFCLMTYCRCCTGLMFIFIFFLLQYLGREATGGYIIFWHERLPDPSIRNNFHLVCDVLKTTNTHLWQRTIDLLSGFSFYTLACSWQAAMNGPPAATPLWTMNSFWISYIRGFRSSSWAGYIFKTQRSKVQYFLQRLAKKKMCKTYQSLFLVSWSTRSF